MAYAYRFPLKRCDIFLWNTEPKTLRKTPR